MVDDNKENSSADIWAGIDAEPSKDSPTDFSFSFEDDPALPPAVDLSAESEAGKAPETDLSKNGSDSAPLGVFDPEESDDDSSLQSSLLGREIENDTQTPDDDEAASVAIDRQAEESSAKESSAVEILASYQIPNGLMMSGLTRLSIRLIRLNPPRGLLIQPPSRKDLRKDLGISRMRQAMQTLPLLPIRSKRHLRA